MTTTTRCLTALLLCLTACGKTEYTENQSDLNVHGIQLYLPDGGQGEHIYTGGEPPIFEWVNDIGTLKFVGNEVYWNDQPVGTVGEKQFVVVSADGEVTIRDETDE